MRAIHRISAISLLAALAGPVSASEIPFRTAMMDMMPMGGGQAAPGGPAPMQNPAGAMPMGNDQMRMAPAAPTAPAAQPGSGAMPMGNDQMRMGMGAAQPMGAGGAAQPDTATQGANAMCTMMQAMMQAMMRGGAAPQGGIGGMPMPAAQPDPTAGGGAMQGSSAARLEGRIAFIRTELRITDAQARAWETFAAALRSSRNHLDQARDVLHTATGAADPMLRLEAYEAHLAARTEAVRQSRLAFDALFAQLNDSQKRAATGLMLPFIGAF